MARLLQDMVVTVRIPAVLEARHQGTRTGHLRTNSSAVVPRRAVTCLSDKRSKWMSVMEVLQLQQTNKGSNMVYGTAMVTWLVWSVCNRTDATALSSETAIARV